jgi:hypothetical protein
VKKRTAIIATSAAVLIVGAALGSNDDSNDAKPAPAKSSAAASKAASDALAAAGIPPEPTGKTRTDLLAALRKVSPALVADPDKAIDNSRNQCSAINGKSPTVDTVAQARFSSSTHNVSEAEAKQVNAALATFCATA